MGKTTTVLLIALAALALGFTFPQATQDYPDAVTADPDHYSVEFENDAVRVMRIKYGPGEHSVLHHHPAHCFVLLSEGTWRMTDAMGEVTEVPSSVGEVSCGDAEVHLPENASGKTGEVVLIEFKGRESFN